MKAKNVIAEWIELANSCLSERAEKTPPFKDYLFINHCQLKRLPSGKRILSRRRDVEVMQAYTRELTDALVVQFVERVDVRLLRHDLEGNEKDELPLQMTDPPQSVIDGTDSIYIPKTEEKNYAKENEMDIKILRQKREALEIKIGGLIHEFERETDIEVGPSLRYDRYYIADSQEDTPITPRVQFDIEIGYDYEDEDADLCQQRRQPRPKPKTTCTN